VGCGKVKPTVSAWRKGGGCGRGGFKRLFTVLIQCLQCTLNCSQSVSNNLTLFLALGISSTLKLLSKRSSETSVYNKPSRRHIAEDGILHRHRRDNFKSYIRFQWFVLAAVVMPRKSWSLTWVTVLLSGSPVYVAGTRQSLCGVSSPSLGSKCN
jgi:hypothetical protein